VAPSFDGPWDIYQPSELDPQLEALAGKRAGLRRRLELLAQDPCHPDVAAYRLSGPLAPVVCGVRLDRGFRMAFTTQPPLTADDKPRVVVLYVGKRAPRHGPTDMWEVLHDLFDVENPAAGHHKPPCCQDSVPAIDPSALDRFLKALRRFNRGR